MTDQHLDVVVVGAGLSGISAAHHLATRCPDHDFAVLEARDAIGGTWDLFRYPGVRSDSDMHTLGFRFRPWTGARAIADGGTILDYLRDAARESGIMARIRLGHRLVSADWSSEQARWRLEIATVDGVRRMTCGFLMMCPGYYDYARGHTPEWQGAETFRGTIVHPQFWPADLDWAGRRVIVIGSGATAVTLVPELARAAAHVTMLQRSPTWIVAMPSRDRIAEALRRLLPERAAYRITRWKNVLIGALFYRLTRTHPGFVRRRLLAMVRAAVGPDQDIATHLTPRYDPWDQRLCLTPDGEFFAALREGRAEIVTDAIDRFVPEGVRLVSGRQLAADIVVTATGLEIALFGGAALSIDSRPIEPAEHIQYKGVMFSDVPNLSYTVGYINASWTLKADLASAYVCRLLRAMRRRGATTATPRVRGAIGRAPFLDLASGYVARARDRLPSQGDRAPWRLHRSYLRDLLALRFGRLTDEMKFSGSGTGNTRNNVSRCSSVRHTGR